MILQGRVRVNGEVVRELGSKVVPGTDRVELNGTLVEEVEGLWVAFHKPAGSLTTRSDPGGRTTVYQLLPKELRELRYVGRLDWNTEGLLLLTNEGDLLHRLTHPSHQVEREYEARVKGTPDPGVLDRLEKGVELEDGLAQASNVKVLRKTRDGAVLSLVLREGRKREVRRLLETVGHPVLGLRRVRFGPIRIGKLPVGDWRRLTTTEIRALGKAAPSEEDQ